MDVIFDIETDNFYQKCTVIHCIALKRVGIDNDVLLFDTLHNNIEQGLQILSEADRLIGHNIIQFDIPVLEKLYPNFIYTHNVLDTLNLSCIANPLRNSHSLESYGKELGFEKLNPMTGEEYTPEEWKARKKIKADAWSIYTEEMGAYCKQDVRLTELILWKCNVEDIDDFTINLSNKFAWIISNQVRTGCRIDERLLERLNLEILRDEASSEKELKAMLPVFVDYDFQVYKRNNSNKNIVAGDIECREVITEFNLKSTQHWMRYLREKYNYEPPKVRRKGKEEPTACLDDEVLATLTFPEVESLLKYKVSSKIRGMIYSNPNSIKNLLDYNNIIYGSVMTEGTATGRCSHNNPNLATMPGVRKDKDGNILDGVAGKYAYEVRSLFIPREGYTFIGFDAKALELCCLAHYLNNKEYIKEVQDGDPHTWTQKKAQLKTRAQAKTFMYAYLYGAGLEKLSTNLAQGSEYKYTQKEVKQLKANFLSNLPELNDLQERLQDEFRSYGYITGLDKRHLQSTSDYKLLNLLLQSTGAVIMKQCLVNLKEELDKRNLVINHDYSFLLNIHDEVQAEVKNGLEDVYKEAALAAAEKTNKDLNLRCKLQIDIKLGKSWAETH